MNRNTDLRRTVIRDCSLTNPDFWELYIIFRTTLCPDMTFKAFRKYYYADGFEYIDVTFITHQNKVAGFCAAAFYKTDAGDKKVTLARAATGITAHCRGNGLPKWALYFKYINYKLQNPFTNLVLTGYIANPLVYAMICKYTGIVYPRVASTTPSGIKELKTKILESSNLNAKENPEYVIKIHFQVTMGKDILQRIFSSDDIYVRYFLSINPRFQEQFGVMVIIPVTWQNILYSTQKFIRNFYRKEKEQWSSMRPALKKGLPAP